MMSADDVRAVVEQLRSLSAEAPSDDLVGSEAIDTVRALEELKGACAGAQARVTAGFAADATGARRARRVCRAATWARGSGRRSAWPVGTVRTRGRGIWGWPRRWCTRCRTPWRPSRPGRSRSGGRPWWCGRPRACPGRTGPGWMPSSPPRPGGLEALGDRETAAEAPSVAYRLDPHAVTARARIAETERRVTLRPAPDTMSRLTGTLPAAQGVAAWAALSRAADTREGGRGRARSGGRSWPTRWSSGSPARPPLTRCRSRCTCTSPTPALFDPDPDTNSEPGELAGYGPVPAALAARVAARSEPRSGGCCAAAAVHPAVRRAAGRDGVAAPGVPGRAAPVPDRPRPDLSDPVVRGADPARRPRHPRRTPRAHQCRQRPRALRGVQLRQTSPRLASPHPIRRHRDQTTTPTGHTYDSRPPPPIGRPPPDYVLAS